MTDRTTDPPTIDDAAEAIVLQLVQNAASAQEAPLTAVGSEQPLVSYAYSYPHKSSYRTLESPRRIAEIWRDEDRRRLALYVHIPFCEMRCGFCNLFTKSLPADELVAAYGATLKRQIQTIRREIPDARFATFAMGGGTPTFLPARDLGTLFDQLNDDLGATLGELPSSVETSPATATPDRLDVLEERGIERISLGVQSFLEADTQAIGRPSKPAQIAAALDAIRARRFDVLNLDLIYGDPAQSRADWLKSLKTALSFNPDELYLYPLYVRPDTGLARTGHPETQHRIDLYRAGRDLLLEHDFKQLSLRCFRRFDAPSRSGLHACQQDGMIGLGCGARSYTHSLHYATRFAVTQAGVQAILSDWIRQTDDELACATHGFALNRDEQQRRYVILSLLQSDGLNVTDYATTFESLPLDDFPQLRHMLNSGWLEWDAGDEFQTGTLRLTEAGMESSDVLGPMLYSTTVLSRLREFVRL